MNLNQLKYPFNGRAKYLIDKFCIIGFHPSLIQKLIKESKLIEKITERKSNESPSNPDKEKKSNINSLYIKSISPILLSEISSDYNKEIISIDLMKDLIFPKGCKFFYYVSDIKESEENNSDIDSVKSAPKIINSNEVKNINNKNKPNSYNVIFSSNPQIENNSKKSINCYAFVFYKKYEININPGKMLYFYTPYTYCIISEYPFYYSFNQLCNQIYALSKKPIEIPLEIILYNIVNFIPSPFNYNILINLDIFYNSPNIENTYPSINNISEKIEENINEKSNYIKGTRYSNKSLNIEKDLKEIKPLKKNIKITFPSIKFEILSGYPLIQYNLVKVLLHKMTPEDIITIFFYTFLERSVIFFSNNIELLSLTINSYINLNFPLNDEKYYFNNVSISFDDYINGNSNFTGTAFTNVIGINSEYREDYISNHIKLSQHLVVDLDNGYVKMVNKDNNSDFNDGDGDNDENIFKFLKKIYKNKEMKENMKQTILYKEVKNIFEMLTDLKKKLIEKNDKFKKIYDGKYIDYDYLEDYNDKDKIYSIKQNNKNIQEAFYSLVNNLCIYFYENLSLKTPENFENKNKKLDPMDVIFNDKFMEDSKYIEEEISFLKELRQTMKFQSFVFGFIKSYNPIDLYKIPLTFTEEFLSMLSSKSNINKDKENKIEFLALIETIYNQNIGNKYKMDFIEFYNQYQKVYKNIIDMELFRIKDNNKIKINLKEDEENNNIIVSSLEYISPELENKIIYAYKNLIDNLDNNQDDIILSYIKVIHENNIDNIKMNLIEDSIERKLMDTKLITNNDICFSNILILYIMNLKNLKLQYDNHIFIASLFDHAKIFRNYYKMIMEIIYYLLMESIKSKNFVDAENYLMIYYLYVNSLCNHRLIPNENLFKYIKKFDLIEISDINKINEKKDNNKERQNSENEEEIDLDFMYISQNFTPKGTVNETDVLKYKNNTLDEAKKLSINEAFKNKYSFDPKIKANNKIMNFNFDIIPQIEIFGKIKQEYNKYISNDLDNKYLNLYSLLEICANIIIYFKYMEEDFDEKDEVNDILYGIYNLYLNLYIEGLKEKIK